MAGNGEIRIKRELEEDPLDISKFVNNSFTYLAKLCMILLLLKQLQYR